MLFDTHIHLDRMDPECDLAVEIDAARAAGVGRFLVPGVDRAGWADIAAVADRFAGVYAAYGLHPQATDDWEDACRDELAGRLQGGKAVAVGEIGLDRLLDVSTKVQEKVFREQLQVAVEADLPVLVHCRRMPGRLLEILEEEGADRVGGILHAYGGSYETAKKAIELGFVISFGGPLTWPEAKRAIEVARRLPDDVLVVETDAPDLAPHPHRGRSNRPLWLLPVVERLAELKGWSMTQAARLTTGNAMRVLRLNEEMECARIDLPG